MKIKLFALLLFAAIFTGISFADSRLPEKKIKIAVTTSNIANLVNEICKDKIEITTIIPATMCPGNYDIDTVTMQKISKSNIILYHPWQPWAKNLKLKISNMGIVYREFQTEGNLMIPYINLRGAKEIKELFVIWDSDNKDFYENNFLSYTFKLNHLAEQISKENATRYNKKIACNSQIADFMQWLGFKVVIQYGKSDNFSSLDMIKLTKKIKKEKVKIIVDNLQAGTDIGRTLSNDLKLKHIVISNFTLGNSYINTLKNNIEQINKALTQ